MLMIQSMMHSLTKTERKVTDLVTSDPEFVMFASITDVAERAQVGETTVIRVCRKLGFRGYQEFKLSIAQHMANPQEATSGPIQPSDSLEVALEKIAAYNAQTLSDTTKLLTASVVDQAADMVLSARRVHVVGVGSSGISAQDWQYRLMRVGIYATCESDSHRIAMICSLTSEHDLVIGISASGSTKDVIDALSIAKKQGAAIICMTNHARSPITHLSRVALLTAARESPFQGGALGTKIAQLHVLDALTSAITLKNYRDATDAIEKTAQSVVDKLL